ncbi:hypothetical protein Tco_0755459 [Tanacetum coccineum]
MDNKGRGRVLSSVVRRVEKQHHKKCYEDKWKINVRPRIGAFFAIFDNVQWRNERGSCDLTVYQKVCVEYAVEYDHGFSLEPCWQILKDHSAWKQEADGSGEEVREVRLIGRDRAKKKATSSSRSEASSVAVGGLVDMVADK